ncbi:MAG: tetratricopeptide repeat protein, partial [Maribacter sp.]
MKKVLYFNFVLLVSFLCFHFIGSAQEPSSQNNDFFKEFQDLQGSEERSFFFFSTPNRYNQNSAYDWLDSVNVYLNSSQKTNDSTALGNYQLIQAQIYYDLGDYEKSLAISKSMYDDMQLLPMDTKALILELMDTNYSKLELYDKQIEIRRRKRDLGLTKNVAFYDIYSSLGQHRKAMRDYMTEEKKGIREDDFYAQAIYNNNIGNYLRLDKSTPTALSYFKKADALLDVYFSDVLKVKTDNELVEANLLKGVIQGNIGKCYVQSKEYKEAIPFLENSIEIIKKYNTGKFSSDLIENTLEVAECYLQLDNFSKATDFLSDGMDPVNIKNILKKNRLYAAYYDKTGDYKSSTSYLKRNIRIRDSIDLNEANIKNQQLTSVVSQDLE